MSEAVGKVAALLERCWVYFTPAATTLCLRLLAYSRGSDSGQPTLYAVRTHVLCRRWNRRHLQQVLQFLEHSERFLLPAETLRAALNMEYRTLPDRRRSDKAWIVGFLDPPHALWSTAAAADPDHVAAVMLLGPQALCRNDEHLATFQELVRACK